MWAAVRYRRAQALTLLVLSALVATCAALAPLHTRALEQGILRVGVDRASVAQTALLVAGNRVPFSSGPALVPGTLDRRVPGAVRALHEPPIATLTGQGLYQVFPTNPAVTQFDLVARTDVCAHLRITAGRCPAGTDQVLVHARDAAALGLQVGKVMTISEKDAPPGASPPSMDLTVVGAYEQPAGDQDYWLGLRLDGNDVPQGDEVPLNALVTAEATFDERWVGNRVTEQYPLDRAALTLDSLPAALAGISALASDPAANLTVDTPLPQLLREVNAGQEQIRLIVPLLMAQLAMLAVVVLASVAGAAVDQRRPEVALARLRGRGQSGATRLVMGELGGTVLAGMPVGLVLAFAVNEVSRRMLLPAGVPFEIPALVWVGLALAAVVSLLAVLLAARAVLREPISSLLRRVGPTRRGGALPVVDVVVVALAVAGLVSLATHSLSGPFALMTPTLISLALGLVLAHLLVPLSGAFGRRRLGAGSVWQAIAAWQVARRPVLRKVLTIVTVASALAVFSVNAALVADRNRAARAQLEIGAPAALVVAGTDGLGLRRAVAQIDPTGRRATTVAAVRTRDPRGTGTLAVVPDQAARIGFPPASGEPYDFAALRTERSATTTLTGRTLSVRVSSDLVAYSANPDGSTAPLTRDQSGLDTAGAVDSGAPELSVALTYANGSKLDRRLGDAPLRGEPARTLSAVMVCPQGCRVDGIQAKVAGAGSVGSQGTVTLAGWSMDGRPVQGITEPGRWQAAVPPESQPKDYLRVAAGGPADALRLEVRNTGLLMKLAAADLPLSVPALLAGDPPPGGVPSAFQATDLFGRPATMHRVQAVEAVPTLGDRGTMVDFDSFAALGGPTADNARLEVWLASEQPADVAAMRRSLAAKGFDTLSATTITQAKDVYDQSASAWGLRLALFISVLAVLMAALVLIVVSVTTWRVVARDFAALAMAGVPRAQLARAVRVEQGVVVVVGSLLGGVCGLAGSWLAMPLVPMFNLAAPVPSIDITPAWLAAALTVVGVLVVLSAVAALIARSVIRRITFSRIREQL